MGRTVDLERNFAIAEERDAGRLVGSKKAKANSDWPKREDGTNKTMGEMTPDERKVQWKAAGARVQKEFEDPRIQEKLKHVMDGGKVQ